ncbi:MAG: glycosyltransferase family 2 protein [Sulfurimonas sp.]|jgi:glycosyltransferase involved in cell wall biosynthesis
MKKQLSVIIPVHNEVESLDICYKRVTDVLKNIDLSYEILFIDDGSTDGSDLLLRKFALEDEQIMVIFLSRNFGKEAALSAGIDHVSGDYTIILDADLQDPPELIPQMLKVQKEKSVDVVLMRRKHRVGESYFKKQTAKWFYKILNRLSSFDIPEDIGDFRLMNKKAIDAMRKLPERNRYTKGLFAWIGMEIYILEYKRDSRVAGVAKQNYLKLFELAFEGISSFSIQPLRFSIYFGVLTAFLGFIFGFYIIFKTLFFGENVPGYPSLVAVITFLGGVQLIGIGILGEYIGKTYIETKTRPIYLVKEFVSKKAHNE